MKLSLGLSPCPNDTFIFDALVNGKVDTGGLEFDVVLEDVQTLNEWAQHGRLDVSKVSYGVLPQIVASYSVLNSGGALGIGVGPLLISNKEVGRNKHEIKDKVTTCAVAIPGQNTTAHFLFSQAFPGAQNKVFLRFDEIENWVASGNGLGVIIHENRFTYQQKGLHLYADLGELWEHKTGLPIPLGGIVARKTLPGDIVASMDKVIQASLAYAWQHYPDLSDYVKCHAQEMDETVMRNHIDLYVNDFSMDMGSSGRDAIVSMMHSLTGNVIQPNRIFA